MTAVQKMAATPALLLLSGARTLASSSRTLFLSSSRRRISALRSGVPAWKPGAVSSPSVPAPEATAEAKKMASEEEPEKDKFTITFGYGIYLFYFTGNEWWDLCAGPHVDSTGHINKKAVELESVAGAYWKEMKIKQMLQRIYGAMWEIEEQLKAPHYTFKRRQSARDHRVSWAGS
ncbi:hypothetical protein J5N97_005397 [Dioscorea zingiberensis]|uniref:Threonyl/alanyl tRNA synthetase SAD domain-containing protein n=1 Tax=Dioscorea zingiberensis TaxID=325984 RepID=A0A9D5D8H4_9LILI|nr:hypothetical protein J5N97_005397 [Dioscorea zingiberensis]